MPKIQVRSSFKEPYSPIFSNFLENRCISYHKKVRGENLICLKETRIPPPEGAFQKYSSKWVFVNIFQISQENTFVGVSF